jgi:hypothetical protein
LPLTGNLESERAITYPGQASWASAYGGKCCRQCQHWDFIGYFASGVIRAAQRTKARAMMNQPNVPRVPFFAGACKYFEENPDPPPAYKEPSR